MAGSCPSARAPARKPACLPLQLWRMRRGSAFGSSNGVASPHCNRPSSSPHAARSEPAACSCIGSPLCDEIITAKIENFKDSPAVLTMIQHIPGQWDMAECNMEYERKDAGTLEFEIELPPKGEKELTMHYHRRNVR